ncbi:mycofactocin system creatininase family protein [Arthrobacter sp. StoSoilA2]|uniref:mycofactocin biosynthesis peptidyl-dipeptidase MftE n=1 Tax=Arthrobacter sp. StoSoilA2 TaxID=2830990 RepID=UPI001E803C43|nr:mycofactocin biosynthesis peptidyl-dipeptidase MftE [Arthrobacter sp. StoSoilA2]BCW35919.1 mycofactocin system creatininase family protein [Arthrobacter sp. StoSoilA2]
MVLVPVGSTEQHGPHLPLDTDSVIATTVAHALALKVEGPVVVAPAVSYGSSGEHQSFPGTVSIGTEVLRLLIVELVRSLSTWAGRIIFVNAHGGNVPALSKAVLQLQEERHSVAWLPCLVPGADLHAGRTETSLMLHLNPSAVRLERSEAGELRPLHELMPALLTGGVAAVSSSGVLGKPSGAHASEGVRLLDLMVQDAAHRIIAGALGRNGMLAVNEPQARGLTSSKPG